MDWVDLWWENIDSQVGRISEFWNTLSEDEQKRAERFHFDRHRERFIVQRGRLREILSDYWDVLPKGIKFRKGTGGKPSISSDSPMIRFNLSHSKEYAIFAIAYGREVGVDVEVLRPKPKAAALVERFFSPNEKAAFRKLKPHEEDAAFFAGWTRKEAYVKAVGKGLRFPLDRFDVSLSPGDQHALLSVAGAPEEVRRWSLRDIDLGQGFRAALAVEMMNPYIVENISVRFRC
ncbi:MAG: 4'-phosphopantetheinyl transferase superfamily protein [Deltaproteobacteria bacterium]|nr:4'-phosphopantetheinyl transferase superfamily protein [Deltaproteobacteria bacterium]